MKHGRLTITFDKSDVDVFASLIYEMQFRRVVDFLQTRTRAVGRLPARFIIALGILAYFTLFFAPMVANCVLNLSPWKYLAIWLVTLPMALYISVGPVKVRRSLLILRKPHQHQNFFQRHEKEFVKVGLTLLGAAAGSLLTYMFTRP